MIRLRRSLSCTVHMGQTTNCRNGVKCTYIKYPPSSMKVDQYAVYLCLAHPTFGTTTLSRRSCPGIVGVGVVMTTEVADQESTVSSLAPRKAVPVAVPNSFPSMVIVCPPKTMAMYHFV